MDMAKRNLGGGVGVDAGVGGGLAIPNPLGILSGGGGANVNAGGGASLDGVGAGVSLGGSGNDQVGEGQQGGQGSAGVGGGADIGGGGQMGGSGGVGGGVNIGGSGQAGGSDQAGGSGHTGGSGQTGGSGGVGGGVNLGGSGQTGGSGQASGSGGAGGGVDIAGSGNTGGSGGVGGGKPASQSAAASPQGAEINNSGSPPVSPASGNSGMPTGPGGSIHGGVGGGAMLGPLPGFPGAGTGSDHCTVMGGQARILYFPPPVGNAPGSGAVSQAPVTQNAPSQAAQGAPTPAQGSPVTAYGNTFYPGSCYLSVETMYATQAPSGSGSGGKGAPTTVGPTFTNAIIPLPSSAISTLCPGSMSSGGTNTAPAQVDFVNGMQDCHQIAAPSAMGNVVPEWNQGQWWNMQWQPPQVIRPPGQAAATSAPPGCPGCGAPAFSPPADHFPSMVSIPGSSAAVGVSPSTPPPGAAPPAFGQYTATRTGSPSTALGSSVVPGVAAPSNALGPIGSSLVPNGTSPAATHPPQYTGAASTSLLNFKGGSSIVLAGLLSAVLML